MNTHQKHPEIIHGKICRHSGIAQKNTTKLGGYPQEKQVPTNSAASDPWVFDVQWQTYPQLEGKLKLYLTCNPEFPVYVNEYGSKPGYVLVQVAPSSKGKEVWSDTVGDDGGYTWEWNSSVTFDINTSLSSIARTSGEPSIWNFSASSGREYCVFIKWAASSSANYWYFSYGFFTMPTKFSKPSTLTKSGNNIITVVQDDEAYTTALEFSNTASPPSPWNNYDDETRALFFEAACQETEAGLEYKYWNSKKFKIWSKTTHTIGVNFMSSVSSDMRSTFKGYVQQVVTKINNTVGSSGFKLRIVDGITDGSYSDISNRNGVGEIQLWWGSYQELWNRNAPSDWRYFGEWNNNESSSNTYLTEGWVKLCTEKVWLMNYQGITWEEIVECLGIGNDMVYDAFSAFSDYWFPAKSLNKYGGTLTPYEIDLDVLRMAYNHNLPSNLEPWDCANRIYAPNGHFYNTHSYDESGTSISFDISCLTIGQTYTFRAISLDYSDSSAFTSGFTVTIEISRPSNFAWTTSKTSGADFNLSATEWNSFTAKINEFRDYWNKTQGTNLSDYSFTVAYKGNNFTADMYRQARTAIQAMSGYGTYIPYVNSGDEITAYMMNILVSELNSVP